MTRTEAFRKLTGKEIGLKANLARDLLSRVDIYKGIPGMEVIRHQTHKGLVEIRLTKKSYSVKVTQ